MKYLLLAASLAAGLAASSVVHAQGNPTLPAGQSSRASYNQSENARPSSAALPATRSTALGQLTSGVQRLTSSTLNLLNPFKSSSPPVPVATQAPTGSRRVYSGGSSSTNRPSTSGVKQSGISSLFTTKNTMEKKKSSESVSNFLSQPRIPFR
ncbi:hypothetical protein [Lignipirellula cremea]|uniref:Uncharacterized protein n=1 Tax=Lignipirellula cremea TaxID=2528010 RepID=A0A518E113_9BACT|nr:hypothetical protein [Lignipirellula cremea]QDU97787.1 hypothetical protein Pla8534_56430 [Lignipirellula cremea]